MSEATTGFGRASRDFIFVEDIVRGLVLCALEGEPGDVYNLASGKETTILELAQRVVDLTGSRSELVFKPLPSDDPTQRCPNITVAREKLGWEPTIKLEEGLKKTIAYFDTLLGEKQI